MSLANSLNNSTFGSQLSVFPATGGFLQVATNPPMTISSVTPATIPHFDCGNKVERDITDILIYHDILVEVSKPVSEKANVNTGGQNFIFINSNVPKETTWTIRIGDNLKPNIYKIILSGKTLRFLKPDGVGYKVTHDDIPRLLLALIHNETDFCGKCAIPKQEFFVLQENRQADTAYGFGHTWMPIKQMTINTAPNTSNITISTTSLGTISDQSLTAVTTVSSDDADLISTKFSTSYGSIVKK